MNKPRKKKPFELPAAQTDDDRRREQQVLARVTPPPSLEDPSRPSDETPAPSPRSVDFNEIYSRLAGLSREQDSLLAQQRAKLSQAEQRMSADVVPLSWWKRALAGAAYGIAQRQPGETFAESIGRGIGAAGFAAAAPKPFDAYRKAIRDRQIMQDTAAEMGLSGAKAATLDEQRKGLLGQYSVLDKQMDNEARQEAIARQRERDKIQEDYYKQLSEYRKGSLENQSQRIANTADYQQQRLGQYDRRLDEIERHNAAKEEIDRLNAQLRENRTRSRRVPVILGEGRHAKTVQLEVPEGRNPVEYAQETLGEDHPVTQSLKKYAPKRKAAAAASSGSDAARQLGESAGIFKPAGKPSVR
jgi:hypothetical protein